MRAPNSSFSRWPYALITGLLAGLAGGLLPWMNTTTTLWSEQASYDAYYHLLGLGSGTLPNPEVVIVYIDLDSHRSLQLDPAKPWPRSLHAKLLERLHSAGALAVVFDVVFDSEREDQEADAYLADAMRLQGNVILAGELGIQSRDTGASTKGRAEHPVLPAKRFTDAAAAWGLSEVHLDQDYTSRRHFAGIPASPEPIPSLTYAAAKRLVNPARMPGINQSLWLRYYGPPFSLPNVSFHKALDRADIPDSFFAGRVVVVGARPWAGSGQGRGDEFRSPFRHWGEKDLFMPGVEVHATQLMNLLRGDALRRLPGDLESLLMGVFGVVLGFGLTLLRSRPAAVTTAILAILIPAGAAGLAYQQSLWFPWIPMLLVQLPIGLVLGSFLTDTLDWLWTRRRLQREKQAAEARIREQAALIDKARDAILVFDLNGQLISANPAAEQLCGASGDALHTRVQQLFRFNAEPLAGGRSVSLAKGEWQGELELIDPSGRKRIVETRWTLISRGREESPALLTINTDVTEKRSLQTEALRAQRMETIGALAGGMAHDLNNALSPILMGVQLLRRAEKDENANRILALIEANTHRGADMVRQVLYFARGRDGEKEVLDIGGLIHEIERLIHDTFPKSISIQTHVARDLWRTRGHSTQIHQLLLNLCVNARDAMPNGGGLSLAVDNVNLSAEEAAGIPDAQPGDFICVMVSDTGTGIPPEILGRIFEAFFTTKAEGRGTGLGLSSCQRIAKGHGGFLNVKSQVGEGTLFEVYLPRLIESPLSSNPSSPAPSAPRGQGEWLLVVDDEEAVRQILKASLMDQGYNVLLAGHGSEALTLLRRKEVPIQLLLCDEELPDIQGHEVATQAQAIMPGLRVLMMSGRAPDAENSSQTSGEARHYLAKPFDLHSALHELNRLLRPSH